ncbi:hypothetical protein BAE44_0022259 [Dichanthelium oligosanthes]|uniref:Delta DNA polymerase n=1 Tax=Dichanthelium oligosanthes TaxID=888268 RepID=A0A1E5UV34_9POAL|nr:hypothetical protein BAE44_0022259 [Dichanthelium oligosanthes]
MTRGGGGGMKSFFRQQKAHTKPTGGVSKKAAPALHAHPAPGHGAVDDAGRQAEERERAAQEFDMDMRYGPCLGLTRGQRLRRAAALGLAPPPALLALCTDDQPCLWEGRV